MRNSVAEDFGNQIKLKWIEMQSMDTSSSARLSASHLKELGVKRIALALVNHAWHLPQAVANFEAMGLTVVPVPMGFSQSFVGVLAFLPSASALAASSRALHEGLGFIAIRLWII